MISLSDGVLGTIVIILIASAPLSLFQPCTHLSHPDQMHHHAPSADESGVHTGCDSDGHEGQVGCCFASSSALLADDMSLLDNDNWSRSHEMSNYAMPALIPSHPWRPPA